MKPMRRRTLLLCTCLLLVGQAFASVRAASNNSCSYKAHSHVVKSTLHWHWIVPTTHETVRLHEHANEEGCTDKVLRGEYNSHRFGFPEQLAPIPEGTEEL